jgi:hypothetical protein
MWKEIQATLSDFGLTHAVVNGCIKVALIICAALAIVYIFGRYLNILKSDRSRNLLAIVCMMIFSVIVIAWFDYKDVLLSLKFKGPLELYGFLFSVVMHFCFSVLAYAFVCWKLFERMRGLFNAKMPYDESKKERSKK